MKKMKRLAAGLLALGMALALTACGAKEQTVSYSMEQEEEGLHMVDTMTLTAKGDKVTALAEEIVITFDAEYQDQMNEAFDELADQYNAVEGVKCTGTKGDGSYTLKIDVDTTGDAVSELAKQGLMEVEGDSNGISLKATVSSLESSGYKKVE